MTNTKKLATAAMAGLFSVTLLAAGAALAGEEKASCSGKSGCSGKDVKEKAACNGKESNSCSGKNGCSGKESH